MNIFPADIQQYSDAHTSPEPPLLAALRRETYLKLLYPRMVSRPSVGRLLAMISRLVQPKRILEVGTFSGYSSICLAEGLQDDGKVITLEINIELEDMIRRYHEEAGIQDKVDVQFGNALDLIPDIDGMFDLVFIDADKANYPTYFELTLPKLRPGGLLIADNVLWSGKALDPTANDKESVGIRAFNDLVTAHPAVDQLLLPVDDGLMFAQKR